MNIRHTRRDKAPQYYQLPNSPPHYCPFLLQLKSFARATKWVASAVAVVMWVLCVFSAYFLDLILLLAKVIMLLCIRYGKVHGVRCTFCNFTKIMSLVGCAATCLHYIKYSLHMGLLSSYCSSSALLCCSLASYGFQSYFMPVDIAVVVLVVIWLIFIVFVSFSPCADHPHTQT